MNQKYIEQWTKIIKNVQQPLQALTELNMKTMQSLSYLKPEELRSVKPEQFFDKQVNLTIENGHKTLDYWHKTFEIFENVMFSMTDKLKESADSVLDNTYPANNMGIASAMRGPANIMDMAQSMLHPERNPLTKATKEAVNEDSGRKSTASTAKHASAKPKNRTAQKASATNKIKKAKTINPKAQPKRASSTTLVNAKSYKPKSSTVKKARLSTKHK